VAWAARPAAASRPDRSHPKGSAQHLPGALVFGFPRLGLNLHPRLKCLQERLPAWLRLAAIFQKVPEGYLGFVQELPGANTQGRTLDEARKNLREAVEFVLEANRALVEEDLAGSDVIREPLKLPA